MTAPVAKLHLVDTTAMRIERGLRALTDCIGDEAIPAATRKELAMAHAALHRCRDKRTVAQMESQQGIGPQGGDAA